MKKTTLTIDGMRCGMCEAHVCDVIRRNFNVKKVTASHIKNQAVVISDTPLDADQLKKAVSDEGYRVSGITVEEYVKKGLFSFFKK